MNLRGHIQPVRAPPPSAASPPAPVSLGSSLTAPPGPVRRVRRGPLLTVPPPPQPECVCAGWEGCGPGEESPREGAACSVHRSLSPALWAPSAPPSSLPLPAARPRSAHVVTLDPLERVLGLLWPSPAPQTPLLHRAPRQDAVQRGPAAPAGLGAPSLPRPRGRGGTLLPAGV